MSLNYGALVSHHICVVFVSIVDTRTCVCVRVHTSVKARDVDITSGTWEILANRIPERHENLSYLNRRYISPPFFCYLRGREIYGWPARLRTPVVARMCVYTARKII